MAATAATAVPLLTDDELERLMIELAHRAGAEGFDEHQAADLVGWAEETRARQRMLERMLARADAG